MEQLAFSLKRLTLRIIALSLLGSALAFFPAVFWIQEVNANLGLHYLILHILSAPLIFIWRKSIKSKVLIFYSAALGLMIARYIFIIYPFYFISSKSEQQSSESLSILYANVYRPNTDYQALEEQIRLLKPDIVALTEFDRSWQQALKLEQSYPHSIGDFQAGHFSLGLYSKFPFSTEPILSLGQPLPPIVAVELNITQQPRKVYLLLIHARPPVSDQNIKENYLIFRRTASFLREKLSDFPNLVLLGDLNATPFSRYYRKLVSWLELKNAMHGYGLNKTWQSFSWFTYFNIDHVLYRGNLHVYDFQVLPAIGSDHYPLFVRFAAPPASGQIAVPNKLFR